MDIQFAPAQSAAIKSHFTRAECCLSVYDRGRYWVGASFTSIIRKYQPDGPRHITVGRFPPDKINTKGEGYVSPKAPCVLPYTFIECEAGDLLDNLHATRNALEVLEAEGYDLDRMHVRYSGNKSFWISIPSAMMGNPIGSVTEQKALRQRMFLPLMETRVDEHLWDARHLHRCLGSRHEKGGRVQCFPATPDLSADWIQPDQPREAIDVLLNDPYAGEPDPGLYKRAQNKLQFHAPPYDTVPDDIRSSGFMEATAGGVSRGERNFTAFRRACVLLRHNEEDEVQTQLMLWNQKCDPPMPEREVLSCIRSAKNTIERKVQL